MAAAVARGGPSKSEEFGCEEMMDEKGVDFGFDFD
jgi:hypothetical protein